MSTKIHKALTKQEMYELMQNKPVQVSVDAPAGAITQLEKTVDYAEACTDYKALIKLLVFKLLRKLRDERRNNTNVFFTDSTH